MNPVNLLSDLLSNKIVFVPFERIDVFLAFCRFNRVFPSGGAMMPDGQYFYIG